MIRALTPSDRLIVIALKKICTTCHVNGIAECLLRRNPNRAQDVRLFLLKRDLLNSRYITDNKNSRYISRVIGERVFSFSLSSRLLNLAKLMRTYLWIAESSDR